ncbi:MAG: hypothetical protein ACI8T1_005004 [Verrucomicrobiales bacterium]|jgi:hypothetical protein
MTNLRKLLITLGTLILAMTLSTSQAEEAPYRHVVLFKFKETASKENVQKVEKAFAALKDVVDLKIKDFEWGTNVSPEGLDNGFTHCFFVTFASKADLDAYLPHQAHKDFGKILRPHLDKVLVVDFVAKKTAE